MSHAVSCVRDSPQPGMFVCSCRDVSSPSSKPDWIHSEPETIGVGVDISDDGSVIALVYVANISWLEPAKFGVKSNSIS